MSTLKFSSLMFCFLPVWFLKRNKEYVLTLRITCFFIGIQTCRDVRWRPTMIIVTSMTQFQWGFSGNDLKKPDLFTGYMLTMLLFHLW